MQTIAAYLDAEKDIDDELGHQRRIERHEWKQMEFLGGGKTRLPPHRKILLDNDQPSHREPHDKPDTAPVRSGISHVKYRPCKPVFIEFGASWTDDLFTGEIFSLSGLLCGLI